MPILDALAKKVKPNADGFDTTTTVKALILTPTRELAAQVAENVKTYSEFLPLRSGVVFGGVNMPPQTKMLKALEFWGVKRMATLQFFQGTTIFKHLLCNDGGFEMIWIVELFNDR